MSQCSELTLGDPVVTVLQRPVQGQMLDTHLEVADLSDPEQATLAILLSKMFFTPFTLPVGP